MSIEPQQMTRSHPRWAEFLERLSGPEACDVKQVGDRKSWTCDHDMRGTQLVLEAMGNIDIQESLSFFQRFLHCDCQILFDLEPAMERHFATELRAYLEAPLDSQSSLDEDNGNGADETTL